MGEWRKSTASNPSGNCVEVKREGGMVFIRSSRDRTGPCLCFYPTEWDAFLKGVEKGEFDYEALANG